MRPLPGPVAIEGSDRASAGGPFFRPRSTPVPAMISERSLCNLGKLSQSPAVSFLQSRGRLTKRYHASSIDIRPLDSCAKRLSTPEQNSCETANPGREPRVPSLRFQHPSLALERPS